MIVVAESEISEAEIRDAIAAAVLASNLPSAWEIAERYDYPNCIICHKTITRALRDSIWMCQSCAQSLWWPLD